MPSQMPDSSELQKKAEGGDAAAEFSLGQAYDFGKGAPQSDAKAYQWYRKAADQDYAPAQNSVGIMYRTGRGVDQNREEAARWYVRSARHGDGKAMFNLGTAYYNGDGVPINDIAALAWFLLAEEHGSEPGKDAVAREKGAMQPWQVASAFESVGDVYEQGKLLPQDHKLAIDWYRKAGCSRATHQSTLRRLSLARRAPRNTMGPPHCVLDCCISEESYHPKCAGSGTLVHSLS